MTADIDAVHTQLVEYLRLNPDTSPVEAVGATGADPDVWVVPVKEALRTDRPHTSLRVPTSDGADSDTGADPAECEEGGDEDTKTEDKTPGCETGKTPCGTVKDTENDVSGDWSTADFTNPGAGTYPAELDDARVWMGAVGKQAFAPWADRDHPEGPAEKDARWKWGLEANYAVGDTVDNWVEKDPRLTGRAFIQKENDPFAFVDGDDVRCPETGEVHPVFRAILQQLGATYADVSTSGAGVHAYYKGDLPIKGKGQATFEIDTEPWGENDTPPTVEVYANTHLAITKGEHIPGTPLAVNEWDADVLRTILQANGYEDKEPISHDTDRDPLDDYEPTTTEADERADDIRDVYAAVEQLTPRDLRLRTSRTGADSTGWSTWDPSYRASESGESLHSPPDEAVFHDHKEGEAFGLLSLFAAEQGIISNPWDRLEGSDWFDAVDAAREAGAPIPKPPESSGPDAEPRAVLPASVRDLTTATSGWDWRHAAEQSDEDLSVDEARDRTTEAIADAYGSGDRVLIEALPTMGKSYGSIKAAANPVKAAAGTAEQITVLTGRGHKEQYGQFKQWCDEFGLSYYQLPSFKRDCETANGDHGAEWADTVESWYNRGATPKQIHKAAENVLGERLPCQKEGHTCSYTAKWDFDPDDYDVLIGHYSHAYRGDKVVNGRSVVFDEFPNAYETTLGSELQRSVSYWLDTTPGIPFDSYTGLVEGRDDPDRRGEALQWFDEQGVDADENHVFDDPKAHAAAPLVVYTLLAGEGLGNSFEMADLGDVGRGAFDRDRGVVSVLRPPDLTYASAVVGLDGTPTKRMWELSLGERLNHRRVLQGSERAEYIQEALNLNIVRTTEYVKPYNNADHVYTDDDAALLEKIGEQHGERPGLITTSTAEHEYDDAGILDLVADTKHYGNVLGSNEFKSKRVGAVIGSNHYGDDYLKKWGAYAGEAVERNDEKGSGLSYGGFGDRVLTHMREHETLQAAMRFGRDAAGAVVYVHTDTLPEWVPITDEGRVVRTYGDGEREVVDAAEDLDTWRTADLAEQVSVGERQVFNILTRLAERGVVDREFDGRGYTWKDDGLQEVSNHGDVELPPVELDEDTDVDTAEAVQEIARSSIYTWGFRNSATDPGGTATEDGSIRSTDVDRAASGENRPPDPAD